MLSPGMDQCSWTQRTNLSYLRFCSQLPRLSAVRSVHPLSLSNLAWPPDSPLNVPSCLQWPPPSWPGCIPGASLTHLHAAIICCLLPFWCFLTNTPHEEQEGRCSLSPNTKIKFWASGRIHLSHHPHGTGQCLWVSLISITLLMSNFLLLVRPATAYFCFFSLP